jgi:anti-anti-sigma factor
LVLSPPGVRVRGHSAVGAARCEGPVVNLLLHFRSADDTVVVYCAGRITFGEEATLLSNQIAALLAKRQHVLLHLGAVEVMDAAGIGTLAELVALARTSGGEIKICNSPEHVRNLFGLTHLSHKLQVYETEEEALAAWSRDHTPMSDGFPGAA